MSVFNRKPYEFILHIYGRRRARRYDMQTTLILAGVPRGGTTWLYETLLATIPNSCGIWEPLYLPRNPRVRALGFSLRQRIDPEDDWKEAEALFADILTGADLNLSHRHNIPLVDYLRLLSRADTYIVKFCRANRLLKWMTDRFKLAKPILLVRHPCAVVASQITHGAWSNIRGKSESEHPVINERDLERMPWIEESLQNLKTPEEKLAATWCLDHYIPLSEPPPHPYLLVSYERLVRDGEAEFGRIFQAMNREIPGKLSRYLRKPSSTTKRDSNVAKGGNPLTTWRKRLSEEQQERILSVVKRFGLDFYTDREEPDYERLYTRPILG